MIKLVSVPASNIDVIWPRLDEVIETACKHSKGVHTKEVVKARALSKSCTIWIAADCSDKEVTAACVTSEVQFPGGLRAMVVEMFGGSVRTDALDFRATLEKKAKADGCNGIVFLITKHRKWIERLPDYTLAQYIMFKEL